MVDFTVNGITYDLDDLRVNDNRGYSEKITPGIGGEKVERFIAIMMDALADTQRSMTTTSATSVAPGSGSKSFTLSSEIPFAVGSWVNVSSAADPAGDFMIGTVTSIAGTALTIDVPVSSVSYGGSTAADWIISVAGSIGATGATSPPDIDGLTSVSGGDAADHLAIYDASASTERKILLNDILGKFYGAVLGQGNDFSDTVMKDHAMEVQNLGSSLSGSIGVNYWNGHYAYGTLTGNITNIVPTNPPPSGQLGWLTLELKQDATGGRTITTPASWKTEDGAGLVIDTSPNAVNIINIWTRDGGTTYYATTQRNMS